MHTSAQGFDPAHYISLSDAFDLVGRTWQSARPLTIRKFLVGIAVHQVESEICGYAQRYEESFVRFERDPVSEYRATPEVLAPIPDDFWRLHMALSDVAGACFAANNLGSEMDVTISELPYRLRDMPDGSLQNERVRLYQLATGVHFPRAELTALVRDPEWQAWGKIMKALEARRRGRPPVWKWDRAKAALTIEAASDPTILQNGSGPIIQFLNDVLRREHHEQLPDRAEVEAYARLVSGFLAPPDDGPPIE